MTQSFSLERYLLVQQPRVEALLTDRLSQIDGVPPQLSTAMGYSLLAGGKRLRPILCLAFAEAASNESGGGGALAEDAACALEYVHTYSLVHDDLPAMDDDDLRRGRPTNHKVHGEAMAILAGDALLTEAFALLASRGETRSALLCGELARASGGGGMVGGQVLDIAEDRPAELDYLVRLHRLKTGALIRAACRMGVIAGAVDLDAAQPQLEAAGVYGDAVGLAFQIADDVLDVTADAETMGKPTGADAAAGRPTFPALMGLEVSRKFAEEQVAKARRAAALLEPTPGPLAALATYALERRT